MTNTSQQSGVVTTENGDVPYRDMPPETDWKMPAKCINKLQQASIKELVRIAKQSHYVDIVVRINGEYRVFQADWIKHLEQQ